MTRPKPGNLAAPDHQPSAHDDWPASARRRAEIFGLASPEARSSAATKFLFAQKPLLRLREKVGRARAQTRFAFLRLHNPAACRTCVITKIFRFPKYLCRTNLRHARCRAGRLFPGTLQPVLSSAPLALQLYFRYLTGQKLRARILTARRFSSRSFPRGKNILC